MRRVRFRTGVHNSPSSIIMGDCGPRELLFGLQIPMVRIGALKRELPFLMRITPNYHRITMRITPNYSRITMQTTPKYNRCTLRVTSKVAMSLSLVLQSCDWAPCCASTSLTTSDSPFSLSTTTTSTGRSSPLQGGGRHAGRGAASPPRSALEGPESPGTAFAYFAEDDYSLERH